MRKLTHEMWNGSGVFIKEGDCKEHCQHPKAYDKQNKVLSAVNIAKKMKLKFTKAWISFLRLPLPHYKKNSSGEESEHHHLLSITSSNESLQVLCHVVPSLVKLRKEGLDGHEKIKSYIWWLSLGFAILEALILACYSLPYSIYAASHRVKDVMVTSFLLAVIPYLSNPIMLCDFLTRSYEIGGVISVMARSSLYVLMTQNGLEYPNFSEQIVTFNSSENGDGTSRDNSRVVDGETEDSCTKPEISSKKSGIDHFNNEESNPVKTDAIRSSLWEIDTLRHHYHPLVSRFVLSLKNDLKVRSKTTEVAVKDFSSGSYATIFRAEIGRRVKQVPLAFYKATPSSLFSESDFAGWTFKYKEKNELFTSGVHNKNIDIYEDHDHGSTKRQRIECS
ncbi:hypothetical protein ACSBR2_018815 [Camellia fascicularis]